MAADERDSNRDLINDPTGAHPVGTGIGATGGAVAGATVGAVGGPIGMAVGGVIGAVVGGLAGRTKLAEQQAEKLERAQYLQSIKTGTRLVATMCPGGEGKYYATGTRPRIKPEVVSCVDVRFRAYCPGSVQYSEGLAHIFVGMAGCFGDTYEITPTPGCKVDQVRVEVVEASECSN